LASSSLSSGMRRFRFERPLKRTLRETAAEAAPTDRRHGRYTKSADRNVRPTKRDYSRCDERAK
jgi:hypothetical protein